MTERTERSITQLLEDAHLRAEQKRVHALVDKENAKALLYEADLLDALCAEIEKIFGPPEALYPYMPLVP